MKKSLILLEIICLLVFARMQAQDVTSSFVTNPSFESGTTGWTVVDMSTVNNDALGSFKKGTYYVEKWQDGTPPINKLNSSVTQRLTLPTGKYTLTVSAQNVTLVNATGSQLAVVSGGVVFAGSEEVKVGFLADYSVSFEITEVEESIDIGFKTIASAANKAACDNFRLFFHPDKSNLAAKIAEAIAVLGEGNNIGSDELNASITSANEVLDNQNATDDEVLQAISTLVDAIYAFQLKNASDTNPVDLSSLIVNSSFENYFSSGWVNDGMERTDNTALGDWKDGSYYVEKWTATPPLTDVSLTQSISEIPNGAYTLIAVAQNATLVNGVGAEYKEVPGGFLFANNNETKVGFRGDYSVPFFVTNGVAVIGFKTINSLANKAACDNFRLQYRGFDINAIAAYVGEQVAEAQSLLDSKMQNAVKQDLQTAISQAQQAINSNPLVLEDLHLSNDFLLKSISTVNISIAAFIDLQIAIDSSLIVYADGDKIDADALLNAISKAQLINNNLDANLDDIYKTTNDLYKSIFAFYLANGTGIAPGVVTNPVCLRGSTQAYGRSKITGYSTGLLLEHGFCWSTSPNPTVLDSRSTKYLTHNGYIYCMENLKPSTVYYVRAYAITKNYVVGYGDVVKVKTIPKGTTTYSYNNGGPEDANNRINAALEEAVEYHNKLTSIRGLHISCTYGSATPTADCSYGGSMRVGPNPSYQRTGTILHEMEHAVGVGTHNLWYGPSSPLRAEGSRGIWLGDRANEVVRFLENSSAGGLTGDAIHMWSWGFSSPLNYGINGANEDNGSELLYTANPLLIQALCEDGLIPTYGFSLPAYTLELKDSTKYYIKSEAVSTGLETSFLTQGLSGNISSEKISPEMALENDSAAWYINYNPVNCYYTFQNVGSGKFFSYKTSGANGIGLISRQTPITSDYFQLMMARNTTEIGSGENVFISKGFWIIHPESNNAPTCLTATTYTTTTTSSFNLADSSTKQRWLLLSEDEVSLFSAALIKSDLTKLETSGNNVFVEKNKIVITDIQEISDIAVFDIAGRLKLISNGVVGNISFAMHRGVYLVSICSPKIQETKKVIVF